MNTFDDKLFSVVKQVQDHENDITGTYTKEEVDGKLEDVKTEVTDTVDSKVVTKVDNIVQLNLPNNKTGQYVVACHKHKDGFNSLVKVSSLPGGNTHFNFKVIFCSNYGNGNSCGIYDVLCNNAKDTTGTKCISKEYNDKLYKGDSGIYVHCSSYIHDVIISGFISSVDDIEFIDDTPENLDLEEITFE